MREVPKERILRVNCSGYGVESHLGKDGAKHLAEYSAIVMNPVSTFHVFGAEKEVVAHVDQSINEGKTSLQINQVDILKEYADLAEDRIVELSEFLVQGGLLIYFLARPFVVEGPGFSQDNYFWLESLSPDKPGDAGERHMSAVSQGRLVEKTEIGSNSEFSPYLDQQALEWTTIIREEFLTDGYQILATAGARKCIAGQLFIVNSSGRVTFLPAPFSPDFDKSLISCITAWYNKREATDAEKQAEERHAVIKASQAAVKAPEGSPLFSSTKNNVEPVAGVKLHGVDSGDLGFSEDTVINSIKDEAARFEKSIEGNMSSENKKTSSGIDLSVFANAAKQLVEKSAPGTPSKDDLVKPSAPPVPPQTDPRQSAQSSLSSLLGRAHDLVGDKPLEEGTKSSGEVPTSPMSDNLFGDDLLDDELEGQNSNQESKVNAAVLMDMLNTSTNTNSGTRELDVPMVQSPAQDSNGGASRIKASSSLRGLEAGLDDAPLPELSREAPLQNDLLGTLFKKTATPSTPTQNVIAPGSQGDLSIESFPSSLVVPEWCQGISFSYLDSLRGEESNLSEQKRALESQIRFLNSKINKVDTLKKALLGGDLSSVLSATEEVFSRLNWSTKRRDRSDCEFLLLNDETPESLVRIVRSEIDCNRSEVAQLAESQISFWDEYEMEPKGVLVACTWFNTDPSGRSEPDFNSSVINFAQKKNLCLITTLQILGIYRDLELENIGSEEIKSQILSTSGQLSGFQVEMGRATAMV